MKRGKSGFNGDLPSELLHDILSYLPLKDVLRFRSISRLWKSIIGDPSFSSLHLIRCPNNIKNPYLIFVEEHWKRSISDRWVLRRSKTYRKYSDVEFPGDVNKKWTICSALDGLVVLLPDQYRLDQKDTIILWNPSIGKSIYLQAPPNPWMQSCRHLIVRLALLFESSSDDHKVLMIRYLPDSYRKSVSAPLFDLYSLKSLSWLRVVDSHSVTNGMMFFYTNVSIGGSAYWIGSNEYSSSRSQVQVIKRSIISIHLSSNKFSSTPLPMGSNQGFCVHRLIVLPESTLGLLVRFVSQLIRIWAMEERSIGDGSETLKHCWTEKYQIQPETPAHRLYKPQIFLVPNQKRNILLWAHKSLSSYDLDIYELKHEIKKYIYTPSYIGPYVESLLLLEHPS